MNNKVILGDNMEYMKTIPDNYFELAIVDPPYGIFEEKKKTGFMRKMEVSETANSWDIRPSPEYFKELFRVSKNQIIWGLQYFTSDLPDFTQPIIWDKKTGSSYFADAELAYCSIKGTARIFVHQWAGCFKDSERKDKAIQACQKPIALYKWLLKQYAKPNDKIFDSHVGSGSIRIACHDMGFDFTGCELNESNFKGQELRFKKHTQQGDLFSGSDLQESIFAGDL